MITHRFGFSAAGVADGFDCAARSAETKAVKVRPDPYLEAPPSPSKVCQRGCCPIAHASCHITASLLFASACKHCVGVNMSWQPATSWHAANALQLLHRSCSTSTDDGVWKERPAAAAALG